MKISNENRFILISNSHTFLSIYSCFQKQRLVFVWKSTFLESTFTDNQLVGYEHVSKHPLFSTSIKPDFSHWKAIRPGPSPGAA